MLFIEGLSIVFLPSKIPYYFAPLLILSSGLFIHKIISSSDPQDINFTIKSELIRKLTNEGLVTKYFPLIGFLIIALDFILIDFFNGYIGRIDRLILFLGAIWIIYYYIPVNFSYERDFLFLFLNFLVFVMIIPTLFYNLYIGNFYNLNQSVLDDTTLVHIFLAKPVSVLLQIFGYNTTSIGETVYFIDLTVNEPTKVFVGTDCTGLYSVAIFFTAFTTFYAQRLPFFNFNFVVMLSLGLLMSYVANLIRMALIILVGHYWGIDNLVFAHTYFGWLIFTFWFGIFWFFAFNRLEPVVLSGNADS